LDSKTGRWLSGDPAVSEYIPSAPVNEEARKRNGSLPGMGGVFNYVNLHVYHYAGNNPVKYVDPDGLEVDAVFEVTRLEVKFWGIRAYGNLTITDKDSGESITVKAYSGGSYNFSSSVSLPIPLGEYDILKMTPNNGFRLEARDSNYGNDIVDGLNTTQSLLRLHGPGRTFGCLSVANRGDWRGENGVIAILNKTQTSDVDVASKSARGLSNFFLGTKETQVKYGTLKVTTTVENNFFLRHARMR
jgi:hypothetical protein